MAVGIEQKGSLPSLDEERVPADSSEGAHGAVHAPRQDVLRRRKQALGSLCCEFERQGVSPLLMLGFVQSWGVVWGQLFSRICKNLTNSTR
jgi:hypothetical protein